MLPALHAFDPVLGLDTHLVLLPSFPTPQPVPVIFIGVIFDWKDYLPPNFVHVLIHGVPRATTGSVGYGKHVPPMPYLRKKRFGEAEVLLGSPTVLAEGDGLGMGPLPALTCHDFGSGASLPVGARKALGTSLMLPFAFVFPLPLPSHVLVGGVPTPSAKALGNHLKNRVLRCLRGTLRKTRTQRRAIRELSRFAKKWWALEKSGTEAWAAPWTPP